MNGQRRRRERLIEAYNLILDAVGSGTDAVRQVVECSL